MKKLALLVFFITIASSNVFSQSFTFTRISPEYVTYTDTNAYEVKAKALLNPVSGSLQIRIIRTVNELSTGWQPLGTSICNYQLCYATTTDTATETYSSGSTDDSIFVYFYCKNFGEPYIPGSGRVRLRAELVSNPSEFIELEFKGNTTETIGINQISSVVREFSLEQNYPNPFNPVTNINFSIPKNEFVSLKVYDILGREVKSLVSQHMTPGQYTVDFDASGLSSGMYYYSIRAGENVSVKKMVLVK